MPADYRRFLLRGAADRWQREIPAPPGWPSSAQVRVRRFFALAQTPDRGTELATSTTCAGRIPNESIPVAGTTCGNVVALGYDGLDAGTVLLCDRARTSTRPMVPEMRAALTRGGLDEPLDDDGIVWYWERLCSDERPWRLGFADTYRVVDSFSQLLALLR